jgi:hypothetical protein
MAGGISMASRPCIRRKKQPDNTHNSLHFQAAFNILSDILPATDGMALPDTPLDTDRFTQKGYHYGREADA